MRFGRIAVIAAVATMALAGTAQAGTISCPGVGGYGREMTLTGVTGACQFGEGAGPNEGGDIAGLLGGTWTKEGERTSNGVNDLLTITADGPWGNDVTGTWSIDPSFWATWGRAVISVHVGNGPASSYVSNPDWFLFEVIPGGEGGAFEYQHPWVRAAASRTSSCGAAATRTSRSLNVKKAAR